MRGLLDKCAYIVYHDTMRKEATLCARNENTAEEGP